MPDTVWNKGRHALHFLIRLAAPVATSRRVEPADSCSRPVWQRRGHLSLRPRAYGAIKILRCTKVLLEECVLLASTPQARMSCSRCVHEARDGDFFWSEAINAK